MSEINILISSSGTGNGFAYCEAIRNNFDNVNLICLDINPPELNASSIYSNVYVQIPKVDSEEFANEILAILNKYKPDFYIALIDSEFSKVATICNELDVNLIGVSDVSLLTDKYAYLLMLEKSDVLVPMMSKTPSEVHWKSDLYIQKPRTGFGSRGTNISNFNKLTANNETFIQEHINGLEVTVDCFRDASSHFFKSTTRERLETKLGVTVKSRIYYNDELNNICEKIMSILSIDGGACIQFIKKSDKWLVIDVNPRLGAGSIISKKMGSDYFSATIAYHLGQDYKRFLKDNKFEKLYVVRQYQEIVTCVTSQ